jgi:VWFA-related protein
MLTGAMAEDAGRRGRLQSRLLRLVGVLCGVCCGLLVSPAQEKNPQNVPTLRTQSNEVFVPTLVKDKTGRPFFGLQARDFIIEDDGEEQQVSMDEAEPQESVSLLIAIQSGRSALKEFQRMKGISAMLDQIVSQPQVQTAIVTFDSQVNLLQDFTFESARTEEYLQKMMSGPRRNVEEGDRRGAAILDAVHYSVKLLGKQPQDSRRVLLLISETRDHGSHAVKIDDVVAAIAETNTVVYTLAFSPTLSSALDTLRGNESTHQSSAGGFIDIIQMMELAREALRKNAAKSIASMTGGEYELFKSRKSFESFMTEFTNHLHSRYLLRFEPRKPRPGLHQLRVRLREPGELTVLARSSYWVEALEDGN